jgi:hypothetical protein
MIEIHSKLDSISRGPVVSEMYNSLETYKLVYGRMHPAGGYGFDGSNGFQPAGRAKAMPDHGLREEDTDIDISCPIMHGPQAKLLQKKQIIDKSSWCK